MTSTPTHESKGGPKYPGLGLPLLHEKREGDAFPMGTHGDCYGGDSELVSVRELAMMTIMDQLTDKPEWHRKVFDEDVSEPNITHTRILTPNDIRFSVRSCQSGKLKLLLFLTKNGLALQPAIKMNGRPHLLKLQALPMKRHSKRQDSILSLRKRTNMFLDLKRIEGESKIF